VVQRGHGVGTSEAGFKARSLAPTAPAPSAPAPKAKLSFKQKHALETLPKQIAKFDAEIASINAALSDPKSYARDPEAYAQSSKRLASAEKSKAKAEDEWLALEELREQIQGSR
jgi:ATP-binding cassette subfamily F protein uup